ncbi:MAG: hypothetical protein ACJAWL_001185 [Motiliproteus sp.]|jgi:hypothetical protein
MPELCEQTGPPKQTGIAEELFVITHRIFQPHNINNAKATRQ